MMDDIHNIGKEAGDIAASIGAAIALLSHWAEVVTPILTLAITLASAGWWVMRYNERFFGTKNKGD